MGEEHR